MLAQCRHQAETRVVTAGEARTVRVHLEQQYDCPVRYIAGSVHGV